MNRLKGVPQRLVFLRGNRLRREAAPELSFLLVTKEKRTFGSLVKNRSYITYRISTVLYSPDFISPSA